MKRLIDQELRNWKGSTSRKSLVLRGARQVGKTYIKEKVIPIEVKVGKGSTLRSLHSFLSSHPKSPYGIKISLAGRSQFENIFSIPLYAAFEIVEGGKERILSLLN